MCTAEGRVSASVEVDHIIPLHKGGKDERENYQGLCVRHHAEKTARDMGYRRSSFTADGTPTDTRHHWHTG